MKNLALLLSLFFMLLTCKRSASLERPDIIYIYTDQQSASMMSCSGNEHLKTPAMDYIAENGVNKPISTFMMTTLSEVIGPWWENSL